MNFFKKRLVQAYLPQDYFFQYLTKGLVVVDVDDIIVVGGFVVVGGSVVVGIGSVVVVEALMG